MGSLPRDEDAASPHLTSSANVPLKPLAAIEPRSSESPVALSLRALSGSMPKCAVTTRHDLTQSAIISRCVAAIDYRGGSSLSMNISTALLTNQTGRPGTTLLPPSRSQSSGRIRMNLAGNYP